MYRLSTVNQGRLTRIFIKDIIGRIIAELEVDLLFTRIDLQVEILVQIAVPEAIGPEVAASCGLGG